MCCSSHFCLLEMNRTVEVQTTMEISPDDLSRLERFRESHLKQKQSRNTILAIAFGVVVICIAGSQTFFRGGETLHSSTVVQSSSLSGDSQSESISCVWNTTEGSYVLSYVPSNVHCLRLVCRDAATDSYQVVNGGQSNLSLLWLDSTFENLTIWMLGSNRDCMSTSSPAKSSALKIVECTPDPSVQPPTPTPHQ
jgi:hypothetical protein